MSAKLPRGESKRILSHLSTMPFVMDKPKMVLLLLINCLYTPYCLCEWCYVFVFVLVCITLCPFSCSNHLEEEDYVFIVSPMSCHLYVLWLFLAVPWVGLQCVIVVFPDHTRLLLDFTNI